MMKSDGKNLTTMSSQDWYITDAHYKASFTQVTWSKYRQNTVYTGVYNLSAVPEVPT